MGNGRGRGDIQSTCDVDRPELLYRPFTPSIPKALKAGSLFDAIAKNDILLHHPFQSFTPIEEAAYA